MEKVLSRYISEDSLKTLKEKKNIEEISMYGINFWRLKQEFKGLPRGQRNSDRDSMERDSLINHLLFLT